MQRVHKQRVCDHAVFILAHRLPLGEALIAEADRLAGGVPGEVAVKHTNVEPAMPAAIVSHGLPVLMENQVAPASQLEPAATAVLDLCRRLNAKMLFSAVMLWLWCANRASSWQR